MLASRISFEDTRVLDLCCGTGNISFEFASREAKDITAVDAHAACVKFVNDTAKLFGMVNLKAYKSDIFKFISGETKSYGLVFADPPYEADWIEKISPAVFEHGILSPAGMLIIEHGSKTDLSAHKYFSEKRNYGNVNFSIFIKDEQS